MRMFEVAVSQVSIQPQSDCTAEMQADLALRYWWQKANLYRFPAGLFKRFNENIYVNPKKQTNKNNDLALVTDTEMKRYIFVR